MSDNQVQVVNSDPLFDAEQAARYLGLADVVKHPAQAMRRLARLKRIAHTWVGGRLMFRRSWLEAFVRANTIDGRAG